MAELLKSIREKIRWNDNGLIPAIAQDAQTKKVLMLAWMNAESLQLTLQEKRAVYWSRSRKKLWRKGETSGNIQRVNTIYLDCDQDAILLEVEQKGAACHTGRQHCFFYTVEKNTIQLDETVQQI